jgi:hypothetical protein
MDVIIRELTALLWINETKVIGRDISAPERKRWKVQTHT